MGMPKKKSVAAVPLRGKVLAHNISPKGHVEGVLLQTKDGTVQVNFPKHAEGDPRKSHAVGATVDLRGEGEEDEGGPHPVYTAQRDGGEVRGTILRLNYARHGEANGYHLDDGTFVHVKPDGAKHYKLVVGDTITATGEHRAGPHAAVLEADEVSKVAAGKVGARKSSARAQA